MAAPRLNKNLTLKNENNFSFYSLNRFFALSLDKIGGTSTIKIKMTFYFVLSSVCTIFAEKNGFGGYKRTRNESILYTETDKSIIEKT